MPPLELYQSIDWPVIVLLAAMIPVGQSFSDTGAADVAAQWLTEHLSHFSLFAALAVMTLATAIFSMFLNNVACAIVMGPVGIHVAEALGAPVDAFLLAVMIGCSSDFLTPIGHQNNLLVMGPGGYRFSDYPRLGGVMLVLVILTRPMCCRGFTADPRKGPSFRAGWLRPAACGARRRVHAGPTRQDHQRRLAGLDRPHNHAFGRRIGEGVYGPHLEGACGFTEVDKQVAQPVGAVNDGDFPRSRTALSRKAHQPASPASAIQAPLWTAMAREGRAHRRRKADWR